MTEESFSLLGSQESGEGQGEVKGTEKMWVRSKTYTLVPTPVIYYHHLGHTPKTPYSMNLSVYQFIDNITTLIIKSAINSVNRLMICFSTH